MSPEGWIFVFGFRLLDVGLLVVWLIWFFRLRDDGEEPPDEGGGGGEGGPEPGPPAGPGGGDLPLPKGRVPAGDRSRGDAHRPRRTPGRRRNAPSLPTPLPGRVRSPSHTPSRIRR